MMKRFEGTDTYIATDDLILHQNRALTLKPKKVVSGTSTLALEPSCNR
jgi:hypothetical protein